MRPSRMCNVAFSRSGCCDAAWGLKVLHWLGPNSAAEAPALVGVAGRRRPPAPLRRLAPEQVGVAGVAELVGVALEDDDVPGRDADRLQAADHLQEHREAGDGAGGVRHAPRLAGLGFTADGVDLDADDVA